MSYSLKNNSGTSLPIYDGTKTVLLLPRHTMVIDDLTPMMSVFVKRGMLTLGVPVVKNAPVTPISIPTPKRVANPVISPAAGSYMKSKTVTVTSTTRDSIIKYTLDSSTPTETAGSVYTAPIVVADSKVVKAMAYKTGWLDSFVVTSVYTITIPTVVTPVILPAAGNYTSAQSITMSTSTLDSFIRYTVDGSTPTETVGTVYTGAFEVNSSETVRAMAYKVDYINSSVASNQYVMTSPIAATPIITPDAGEYTFARSITMSTTTPEASIKYTVDGSTPTETVGTVYTAPFIISSSQTVKAITYKTGYVNSSVVSNQYVINIEAAVADPAILPAAGDYTSAQSVTINCSTSGASIRYSVDGSTPSDTVGTVYSGAFDVSVSETVKAVAYKAGSTSSSVVSSVYTVTIPVVTTPVILPVEGDYTSAQTISISTTTDGASVRYTLDGSTPSDTEGTVYSGTFDISVNQTVKAIAYKTGWYHSYVASNDYVINIPGVENPVILPTPGDYPETQSVSISTATSGAEIRYSVDGTDPSDTVGTIYTAPFDVAADQTVKAVAFKNGWYSSQQVVANYTITIPGTTASPVILPIAGNYTETQSVTISTATDGATIRYSVDGTDPSKTVGTVYSGAFDVTVNQTVKAIAYKTKLLNSAIASNAYTITVSDPVILPAAGDYTSVQSVSMSTTTPGASINYTLNGSDPSDTVGVSYIGAFEVGAANCTIKAITYKDGCYSSSIVSNIYTITIPETVSTPEILPITGTYEGTQSVTISDTTPEVEIRYTLDGSDPSDTVGTVYTGAISISTDQTIKAVAYKGGWYLSAVASNAYTITIPVVATPEILPAAGDYTSAQSVIISDSTEGASIRYSVDGTDPSDTAGTVYTVPFDITESLTVKAIGYKAGSTSSSIASSVYTVTIPTVETPVLSPVTGSYEGTQSVTISDTTPEVEIRYTLDGSDPSYTVGTVYTVPFDVTESLTVKAVAYKGGWYLSEIASSVLTISAVAPVMSPVAGEYPEAQSVTITSATTGAEIRYTLDDLSNPTSPADPSDTNGTLYTSPIDLLIDTFTQIKAVAYKSGMTNSTVVLGDYTIVVPSMEFPIIMPVSGEYPSTQSVTIECATSGASIRYTVDGSLPSETEGLEYTGSFDVSETCSVKAIAYKTGYNSSSSGREYTITV